MSHSCSSPKMADFSRIKRPSTNLSLAFEKSGAKGSIDRLEINISTKVEDTKRKAQGRERLTSEEIQALNDYSRREINLAFNEAKENIITQVKIKASDSPEETVVKIEISEEVTGFVQKMTKIVIEAIEVIISAAITEIGRKIKSVFSGLWSWITG